uniref:Copia protein n=1 Tax=Anoplophora glabripennis TaxID=217634 RepID=V5H0A2_ANOGL
MEQNLDEDENTGEVERNVPEIQVPELRPQRNIKLPSRYKEFDLNFVETDVPNTYEEAIHGKDAKQWEEAIEEELTALKENDTWEIIPLPPQEKIIDSKWVFRVKRNKEGSTTR